MAFSSLLASIIERLFYYNAFKKDCQVEADTIKTV